MTDTERIEELETWITEWVATGEFRSEDGATGPWEVYAGWLEVVQMPERVKQLLGVDHLTEDTSR